MKNTKEEQLAIYHQIRGMEVSGDITLAGILFLLGILMAFGTSDSSTRIIGLVVIFSPGILSFKGFWGKNEKMAKELLDKQNLTWENYHDARQKSDR